MLILDRVIINNFLSAENMDIDLKNRGIVLVKGENLLIKDSSNGSGKSLMSDAIIWALYGKPIREAKEVSNIETGKPASVTLRLEYFGNKYEITRLASPNSVTIIKNGEDISGRLVSETKEILEREFVGLSQDLIQNCIILGQDMPKKFTANSAPNRKAVLEELTNTDYLLKEITDKLGTKMSEVEGSLKENEISLVKLSTTLEISEKELIKIDEENKILEEEKSVNFEEQIASVDLEISAKNDLIFEQEKLISQLEVRGKVLKNYVKETTDNLSEQFDYEKTKLNEAKQLNSKERFEINYSISQLKNSLEKASSNTCPTCKTVLREQLDTSEFMSKIEKLTEELTDVEKAYLDTLREMQKRLKEQGESRA